MDITLPPRPHHARAEKASAPDLAAIRGQRRAVGKRAERARLPRLSRDDPSATLELLLGTRRRPVTTRRAPTSTG